MRRSAPLQMTPDEFRAVGHRLVDQIAERLARVPEGPVKPDESADVVRAVVKAERGLPQRGTDPQVLLTEAADLLFDHSNLNGHPRFFGYITSSPAPIGMFGDLLAAAVNANCGGWAIAPAASEIEVQTVRWIAEFIGFPSDTGGVLVSGGNMANFVCFLAARTAKAGWDVRKTGLATEGMPSLVVYASAETHTWIQKAADLFGLGTDAIRWIPVDAHQRMKTSELRRQIEADRARGHRPFLVVGTAGSVSTGAVDPLPDIAAICRELDLWFHVDGAYGALAAPIPEAPADLRGLVAADSLAVDPHKWLYAPLEAGCALVRRAEDLRNAFSYHPPYYKFKEDVVNFVDYGPQNSRGFRALKVWLALQHIGRAGYEASIAEDMRLSRRLAEALRQHGDFEVLTQGLSITTFRYVPHELRGRIGEAAVLEQLNRLNQDLLSRVEKSGEAFLSNAVVDGRYALRACIVNFNTSAEDVDALPGIVARQAAQQL
ncbi:MAG: aminotransferase class V-fold PLP-dependent enzyme [Acidobacteria bacterium]|nr:MAG: aminotransferase class V-fold PLP-dependent enzyme [Acidobacteriota bacterium]